MDQAQRCFRRCASARPEDPGALLQLAACRARLGKYFACLALPRGLGDWELG